MTPAGSFAFHQRRVHEVERGRRFRAIAFHESSHAVAARYLGVTVSKLRLNLGQDGIEAGACWHDDALSKFDLAMLLSAGAVGERRAEGAAMFHYRDDAEIRTLDLPAADEVRARADAEAIVTRHWTIVRGLAEALVDNGGILEGADIERHLARVARRPPVRPSPVPGLTNDDGALLYRRGGVILGAPRRPAPTITGEIIRADDGLIEAWEIRDGKRTRVGKFSDAELARAALRRQQFVPTYRARSI
jgi:hypothetical protein